MGQYYRIALVRDDEMKVIRPDGVKMMEHSWYESRTMRRIEKLLSEKKYRPLWVGDYAQCAPLIWNDINEIDDIWTYTSEEDEDENICMKYEEGKIYYLVNHTRKSYINMTKQQEVMKKEDQYGWVVHPLPLLCRVETEEAGGDYHSQFPNYDKLGEWCGDEISVEVYDGERTEEFEYFGYKDMTDVYYFIEKEGREWPEE